MARTHGTKSKGLPESLLTGLMDLGYVEMPFTAEGVPVYRHPKQPHLMVMAVASNMPGSHNVIAQWFGVPSKLIDVDRLLAVLAEQLLSGKKSRA
jgi:hypothetical protein